MFCWTPEREHAFQKLKELLANAPIVVYPRFGGGRTFRLETNASTIGLGALLSQEQDDGTVHPVAYMHLVRWISMKETMAYPS